MKATESMLVEVDITSDEFHLSLMDSSHWFVNPEDLPVAGSWHPETRLKIEFYLDDSTYAYKLTSLIDDSSVRAMKIG